MAGAARFFERFLIAAGLMMFVPADQHGPLGGEPTVAAVRIFYAPKTDLETVDRQLIDGGRRNIDMAAYVLTNRGVISALVAAAKRGVKIRLYLDPDQTTRPRRGTGADPLVDLLDTGGVEARFKKHSTDMHMKAYQVDGRVLRSGSANFSFSGAKQQDNDAIVIDSAQAAANFISEFEFLWSRRDNELYSASAPVARRP